MHLTAPGLAAAPRLAHGFFTRQGGVSEGPFASRNCGYGGDRPEHVAENRARSLAALGLPASALLVLRQIHSAVAVTVREPWPLDATPGADALVTDRPGLALGILTADCAPVLLHDAAAGVIGAAHAGWRGALDGILEAAIEAMRGLGARPARIVAAIGPTIAEASYEVGPEFRARFLPGGADLFRPGAGDRWHFDLPRFVARRLAAAGVGAIEMQARDTCAEADNFFSFRRAARGGARIYGSNLSAIALLQ